MVRTTSTSTITIAIPIAIATTPTTAIWIGPKIEPIKSNQNFSNYFECLMEIG